MLPIDFSILKTLYNTGEKIPSGCSASGSHSHQPDRKTIITMYSAEFADYRLFRNKPDSGAPSVISSTGDKEKEQTQEYRQIVCRQCRNIITRPEEKIEVNGSHQHTFANPNGQVFEIGCFQTAEGCGYTGEATEEYSWFRGYAWRVAVCGRCLTQIGWLFSASMGVSRFNGLILDRLILP